MSLFGGGGATTGTGSKPGLSINTGAANLFGGSATNTTPATGAAGAAAGGGLFGGGAAAASKPTSAGTLFGTGASTGSAAGATTPSLFGGNTGASTTGTSGAPSAAGTLFGGTAAAAAASKPAAGGLFGSSTTGTGGGGSLFGNTAAATSAPASGGLFGASMNQPAAATGGGGLFGSSTTTNTAAPASTSLFGAPKATQPAGGGLFGNTTTATTGNTGGSLFGNAAGTGTNTAGGGGLFGSTTAGTAAAPATGGGGLFGASTQQNNNTNSLFGNNAAAATMGQSTARPGTNHPTQPVPQQTQRSIFTSSIGQYTASQAAVPGVRVDASNLRPTTRFADLHEALQQELEKLDALILKQQAYADECVQALPAVASALSYVPGDADFCAQKLSALQATLGADAADVDALKTLTRGAADDAKISFRNISALRTPSQYTGGGGVGGGGNSAPAPVPAGLLDGEDVATLQGRDLAAYMSKQVSDMERKLSSFRSGLGQVESYLQGVEAGTLARVQSAQLRSADDQVRELAGVLRDFEGGILHVAGKVGAAREATQGGMLDDGRGRLGLGGLY